LEELEGAGGGGEESEARYSDELNLAGWCGNWVHRGRGQVEGTTKLRGFEEWVGKRVDLGKREFARRKGVGIVTFRWRNWGGSMGQRGLVNKWMRRGWAVSEGKRHLFAFI
jgi:hypothetical protein